MAVHDSHFYIDPATGLFSRYAGYTVRTGTAPLSGAWIQLGNFTGGVVALNSGQPAAQSVADLASGSSATSFFMLTAPVITATPQTHTITLYDGVPALGGAPICSRTFTYSDVVDTIKALANKVRTITSSVTSQARVGDLATITVNGDTGQLGAGPGNDPGVLDLAPNAMANFPAGSWQLVRSQITLSPNGTLPAATFVNKLYLTAASGPDRPYTALYTFKAIAPLSGSAEVKPIQYIASGTQVKHTDVGSIPITSLPGIASNGTVTIAKTASVASLPAGGGNVTYTLRMTNTGSTALALDQLVDVPPSGASYVAGSVRVSGAATGEPATISGSLVFDGPFVVPAFGTLDVTYTLTLGAAAGTKTNSAYGRFGTLQIDSTADVTDNSPATASVVVRSAGGPNAVNDSSSTTANTSVAISVLTNDTTTGTDPFSISAVGAPSSGTAVKSGNQIIYTPGSTFSGIATFTYTISDGTSTSTATVSVTVSPLAINDNYTAGKGQTKTYTTVLANDVCVSCTVSLVTNVSAGTLTLNSNGTFTYAPAGNNTVGTFTFTYRATDPATTLTSTATVTIYMNDAAPDYVTTPYQTAVIINPPANDTCGNASQCRPSASTNPTNGVAVYNADNTVTYTPNNGFWGLDTWIYRMPSNDSASITVLTAPPASTFTTTTGTAVSGTLPTGRVCSGCTYSVSTNVANGTLAFTVSTGAFTYTPSSTFSGTDSFVYKVLDPVSGLFVTQTITLKVGPDAVDDAYATMYGTNLTANVSSNDVCAATCTWAVATQPAGGSATVSMTGATGAFTFSGPTKVGPITFTYTATSSVTPGVSDTATVTVVVQGAVNDTSSTPINTPVTISVKGNDPCAGCTVSAVSTPSAGTASINSGTTVTYTPPTGFSGLATFTYTVTLNGGSSTATVSVSVLPQAYDDDVNTLTDRAIAIRPLTNDLCSGCAITSVGSPSHGSIVNGVGGVVTYTPSSGFAGHDSFTYTITDPQGNTSSAVVTVDVVAPPSLTNDSVSLLADTSATIDVLANDSCSGCELDIASDPSHGSVSLAATGSIVYIPSPGYSGVDSFQYLAFDPVSGVSNTATVSIVVRPTATDDHAYTGIGSTIDVDVVANDSCTNCTSTIVTPPNPAHGTASVVGGKIRFVPAPGVTSTATVTYRVTDPTTGEHADAVLTIEVNDAVTDATTTPYQTTVASIDVLANDICPGCQVVSVGTTTAGSASINPNGTVRFVPNGDFYGIAVFSYTVSDGATRTASSTVRVLVGPPERTYQTPPSTTVADNVLADGVCANCTVAQTSSTDHGDVEFASNGDWTYTPVAGYIGTDTLEYSITDPVSGLSVPGVLHIVLDLIPNISVSVSASGFDNTVVTPNGRSDAGDAGLFSIVVTNTGDKVLTSVSVTGPNGSTVTCTGGSSTITNLATGASATCTARRPLTQPMIDNSSVSLSATVVGTSSGSPDVTDDDSASQSIAQAAALTLDKSVTTDMTIVAPADRVDVGDELDFTFTVTNSGNVTVRDITVSDEMPGLSAVVCAPVANRSIELAPGESATCTATYELSQDDVDAGTVSNDASVLGTNPIGGPVDDTDSVSADLIAAPALTLDVSADVASVDGTDDLVTFTYVVTNDGNVTVSDITIDDCTVGLSVLDCGQVGTIPDLAPGEQFQFTATYLTSQADLDAGEILENAVVTGLDPDGGEVTADDDATVTVDAVATISLDVSADTTTVNHVGETITYTYDVTNTGNVTLTAVELAESAATSALDCPTFLNGSGSLAPGASFTCTTSHDVTQADLDAGSIEDAASVQGTPPQGPSAQDDDSVVVSVLQSPSLQLTKTSDHSSVTSAGTTIEYTFAVSNTGNVTVAHVEVTDDLAGLSALDCGTFDNGADSLAPGETARCTATYTVSQADIDAGGVTNHASVTGAAPDGSDPSDDSSTTTTVDSGPSITLSKTADVATVGAAGDEISYTIVAVNTGNVTLDNVSVTDAMSGLSALDCGTFDDGDSLAPGSLATCTARYTATQADIDAGSIVNDASVSSTDPDGGTVTDDATVTVAAPAAPGLVLDKTSDVTSVDAVGDVITYTLAASNTGNVTLSGITLVDDLAGLSALDCGSFDNGTGSLAPGETATCTATYTVDQADLDSGLVRNDASVSGDSPDGPAVDHEDRLDVLVDQQPSLELDKTADRSTVDAAGDGIVFTITVLNTGNVTIEGVAVDDQMSGLSALECGTFTNDGLGSLAPGESAVCTASYTTTQNDVDAGSVVNIAEVNGSAPDGGPVGTSDSVTVDSLPTSSLTFSKTADVSSIDAVGDVITYTLVATNNGTSTLSQVTISDPLSGLSALDCVSFANDGTDRLAPGESAICSATYTVAQADLDSGSVVNTATVDASTPDGDPVEEFGSETVTVDQTASMTLDKTANVSAVVSAGDAITYSLVLTNTGNVTLSGVIVSDDMQGLSALDCGVFANDGSDSLAPGASATCVADYAVTQGDIDSGSIDNQASAEADTPDGDPVSTDDAMSVPVTSGPAISAVKTADVPSVDAAGDTVTYTITVSNTGNVTLTNVSVSDPMPGLSTLDCAGEVNGTITLAPSETASCTADYTATQDDIDAGGFANTATVTADDPGDNPLEVTASESVDSVPAPGLSFVKTSDVVSVDAVGDVVTYVLVAENTGNVTLDDLLIADSLAGLSSLDCGTFDNGVDALAPGESATCIATYTVTQNDLDAGSIVNLASVRSNDPTGDPVDEDDSTVVQIAAGPSISLSKSADAPSVDAVGDTITYTLTATNTGNVTLGDVLLVDSMPGLSRLDCGSFTNGGSLAPNAIATCTATYTVTQADLDAGSIGNLASVSATDPSDTLVDDEVSESVDVVQMPSMALTKSADLDTVGAVGTDVTFTIVATNTGNVTLDAVTVVDDMAGLSALDCGSFVNDGTSSLAPGAQATCTASYAVTQADLDAGLIENTASITADSPTGDPVGDEATETVAIAGAPAMTLTKTADVETVSHVGDVITYTIVATNAGNVTLDGVVVTDDKAGLSALDCGTFANDGFDVLEPGDAATCTATYTATQADLDAGTIANSATVVADDPSGDPTGDDSTVDVDVDASPSVSMTKVADVSSVTEAGDSIEYTIEVQNTGNVTLHDVVVADAMPGLSVLDCADSPNDGTGSLAPGETITCTATYAVTQDDIDAGSIGNEATFSATAPDGSPVESSSTETVDTDQGPAISLVKSADVDTVDSVGDEIVYTLTATNTGNVTLDHVTVTDDKSGLSSLDCGSFTNGVGSLSPGASAVCTATYVVTQDDLDGGTVNNVAAVTAHGPGGDVQDESDEVDVDVDQAPSISVDKTASVSSVTAAGAEITYSVTVVNTGNVTLDSVVIDDPMPGLDLDCGDATGSLVPGASIECTGTHTVTLAEMNGGSIVNTVTVTGSGPADQPIERSDSVTVDVVTGAAISIDKSASRTNFAAPGDVVEYSLLVANTGNVSLTGVTVSDDLAGLTPVDCGTGTVGSIGSLDPGQSVVCTASLTITQAHVDGSAITNTAVVSGAPSTGGTVHAVDSVTVSPVQNPKIEVQRTTEVLTLGWVGQPVTFNYRATNTGNVTLRNVSISDPLPGLSAIDCGNQSRTLAPTGFIECTAQYEVTQTDLDRGEIASRVSATALPPEGESVEADDSGRLVAATRPAIGLDLTPNPAVVTEVGQEVVYTYEVANTGNTSLGDFVLTDDLDGLSAIDCPDVKTLASNETMTCTATYEATQSDIDAGSIDDKAVVTAAVASAARNSGLSPRAASVSAQAKGKVKTTGEDGVELNKTVSPSTIHAVGDTVVFSFEVTNTGSTTLTDVEVVDPMPGLSEIDCGDFAGELAPGESTTCTADYTVTLDDVVAGTIVNTAQVVSESLVSGVSLSDSSTASVSLSAPASIELTKTASDTSVRVGQTITYTILAHNTGGVALKGVVVTDPLDGLSALDCGDFANDGTDTLAPDATATCTATYVARSSDVGDGVVNTASVSSTMKGTDLPINDTGTVTVGVAGASLPATGSDIVKILVLAIGTLLLGWALASRDRRRLAAVRTDGRTEADI